MTFSKGEMIKCIDNAGIITRGKLTIGKEYKVLECEGEIVWVPDDNAIRFGFYIERFTKGPRCVFESVP